MGKKALKKSIASVLILALSVLNLGVILPVKADTAVSANEIQGVQKYNYAKALQLSMYFYDANKCGSRVDDGALSWRSNCHEEDQNIPLQPVDDNGYGTNLSASFIKANKEALDPDGNGCVNLDGGFHDAGDHVKFGLPQSYSGSTLGWGYYEFRDSYASIGEQEHIEDILRWFNDYFLRCTFRNKDGKVIAFAYQVGDGTTDHNYWGSPELQTTPRPAWFATAETPASDQCASAAASLAINYLNFKDTDSEYAEKCLDTAKALYVFARENRGTGFSGGFYNSSYDEDEMSWAAVWLNIITGEEEYIDDIVSVDSTGTYTGYIKRIIITTDSTWQNIWVHSWDTVWGGVFAKLAPITDNPEHWYFFRWNIEYWSGVPHEDPNDGTFMAATPDGFKVINTWGSARYNTAAQLCALVYNKYKPNQDFVDWCKDQMDYILGDNPMNRCYEVGYAENSAKYPHHRAAHGSLTNSMLDPEIEKHVLWGALVGGPDAEDNHKDNITDYVYNEVAIDYNAGFVGALAALYAIYGEGQEPDPLVPVYQNDEMPYFIKAKIEQESKERTQLTIEVTNDTSCPPKRISNIKVRYFFNISEMTAKGQSINDLSFPVMYDQTLVLDKTGVKISDPVVWDEAENIYYIELDWSGISFHGSREIQIGLVPAQDKSYNFNWDPTDDWSRQGLTKTKALTEHIPVYLGNKLVYGVEPVKGESVKVSITAPSAGTVLDYTKIQTPVEIEANVEAADCIIDTVEFYADDEKIGEDSKKPYTCSYTPTADSEGNDFSRKLALTAKAITQTGKLAVSDPVALTVIFTKPEEAVVEITEPKEGTFIDTTEGSDEIDVAASRTAGAKDEISKIEIYANGKMIGEKSGETCNAVYTAPASTMNPDGFVDIILTAKAILENGDVRYSVPVNIKVKVPVEDVGAKDLILNVEEIGNMVSNTIGRKFTLTNTGNNSVNLNNVVLRYYFTKDTEEKQVFYCDDAGMTFNAAPWYTTITDDISGKFVRMNPAVEGADTYLEISFAGSKNMLDPTAVLNCQFRIGNADWSEINQDNDYSSANEDTIVILSNGIVVRGMEPK
jgi:endoglucanase